MRIFLVLAQTFCLVGVLEGADVSTCLKAASCSWIHCWRVGGLGLALTQHCEKKWIIYTCHCWRVGEGMGIGDLL